jgi:hypothetical protein
VRVRFDRSGEHRSFPVHPDPHGARHLEDMSDEDLYHQLMGRGEGEHFDRAVAELDRRDHAARQQRVKQLYARQPRGDEERGQLYQQLVDEGENPEDAWAHAHGATTDELRRQAAVAQLRQQGYRGSGFDAVARSAYKDEVHRSVLDAEAATNGYLTSPEGKRKGIDGWSLFTGTEARARRYASPELREYWDQHGRLTFDDFKAMLLGHHGAQGPRGGDFYA